VLGIGIGIDRDVVRPKGGLSIALIREHRGEVARVESGETFHPGDRARFEITLPVAGHVRVIGVEAGGAIYPCVPVDLAAPAPWIEATTKPLLLDDTVAFDASLGREQIYVVRCPRPFTVDDLHTRGADLDLPAGCESARFSLEKAAP